MSEYIEILLNGEYFCMTEVSDEHAASMLLETEAFKVSFPVDNVKTTFKAVMSKTRFGLTLNMERIH